MNYSYETISNHIRNSNPIIKNENLKLQFQDFLKYILTHSNELINIFLNIFDVTYWTEKQYDFYLLRQD